MRGQGLDGGGVWQPVGEKTDEGGDGLTCSLLQPVPALPPSEGPLRSAETDLVPGAEEKTCVRSAGCAALSAGGTDIQTSYGTRNALKISSVVATNALTA